MRAAPSPRVDTAQGFSTRAIDLARSHPLVERPPALLPSIAHLNAMAAYVQRLRPHFSELERTAGGASTAEWFLDNDYRILRAIRQVREDMPAGFFRHLPALEDGRPRIWALARALLLESGLEIDFAALVQFTRAYQEESGLRVGELWAMPAMLRLAVLEEIAHALLTSIPAVRPKVEMVSGEPLQIGVDDTERLVRGLRALQVLDAIRWQRFFRATSRVEDVLRKDPAGVYPGMDFETCDRYRKVVEEIARRTGREEIEVASAAVERAAAAEPGERASHVGHWLVDAGRRSFEESFGYRPGASRRWRRRILDHPAAFYLGGIAGATALFWAGPLWLLTAGGAGPAVWIAGAAFALLPASTLAVTLVQWILTHVLPPRVLPKIDFDRGLPRDCRTLVAIPTLLGSAEDIRTLIRRIEIHYLSNPDPRLEFAIVGDFLDAARQTEAGDAELLRQAETGIRLLNDKYQADGHRPFHLLHRSRQWNPSEGCWMGWERKRGKLEELGRLLSGAADTTYDVHVGEPEGLEGIRFVITLDTDTLLPRGSAARLVGILAHPLNRAQFDPQTGRVVAGYTVVQPRIEISPAGQNRSPFGRIYAGDSGIDIYSRAVSDVYQDLVGEGMFIGKGIYDVQAFQRSLEGRVPDNAILSHDLFEGVHGRAALATDAVLYEDYPPHYLAFARRLHRWVRGDWQLLPWLGSRVPDAERRRVPSRLSAIDRWKILDNLRRSLLNPLLLVFLVVGWFLLPGHALLWTAMCLLVPGGHIFTELVTGLTRSRRLPHPGREVLVIARGLRQNLGRWILFWAFLPHEAAVIVDAVARTLTRLYVTKKRLLEWRTAAATDRLVTSRGAHAGVWTEMFAGPLAAALIAWGLAVWRPQALLVAAPLLLMWLASPELARLISRPSRRRQGKLSTSQHRELRKLARRTWLFFETFVGPEDQWLPPDNFQEDPRGEVAHRTSPTNIGMYLLSTLTSHDLGYLGLTDLVFRLRNTFESLERLERSRGHLLNWYDTRSLEPLEPRYVSTVDSGNLAGALLALKQGCAEAAAAPVLRRESWQGLRDLLALLADAARGIDPRIKGAGVWKKLRTRIEAVSRGLVQLPEEPAAWCSRLDALCNTELVELDRAMMGALEAGDRPAELGTLRELRTWFERLRQHLRGMRREAEMLIPWADLLSSPPEPIAEAEAEGPVDVAWRALAASLRSAPRLDEIPSFCASAREHLDELRAALGRAPAGPERDAAQALDWVAEMEAALASSESSARYLRDEILGIGTRCEAEARGMDFTLLYDQGRHLFHIGYNLSADRLDPNRYDLLASEARLASFFAIAKGDVPQKHWFFLGRPATRAAGSPALLSWGGTMFEYLMPPLLMLSDENTFLARSCRTVVDRHIAYGAEKGVPWGVSEAAYHLFDPDLHYQYRAFGVPGLGFKRGLADDLVVAPYASMLALSHRPAAVMANLDHLRSLRAMGRYGLFESIDFTRARLPEGRSHAVVRTYMAHHQGMILTAIGNHLLGDALVRRFHADSLVQTAELLLHEQVPPALHTESPHRDPGTPPPAEAAPRLALEPWTPHQAGPHPEAHVLSNGSLSAMLTDSGGGSLRWRGLALTRWSADPTRDHWGMWLYVRDEESGQLWSAGRNPCGPGEGEARSVFHPHMVELNRREQGVSLRVEVAVAPGDDVEVRRVAVVNETDRPRRITLTSYAEVSLSAPAAGDRHPAFDKLFVRSEHLAGSAALLFGRRARSSDEKPAVLLQQIVADDEGVESTGFETDRDRFLGRGATPRAPGALAPGAAGLSGRTGSVLDPASILQATVELPPHGTARLAFVTLASDTREGALRLSERFGFMESIDWAIENAAKEAGRELRKVGIEAEQLPRMQSLLSALLFPCPNLRPGGREIARNRLGKPGLWGRGISGDLPILLLHLRDLEDGELLEVLLRAHRLWRRRGIRVAFVVLVEAVSSYEDDTQDKVDRLIASCEGQSWLNRRGGLFVVRADQLPPEERRLLEVSARCVLDTARGTLEEQTRHLQRAAHDLPRFVPPPAPPAEEVETPTLQRPDDISFDNGLGGFSADGREYVIHLEPGQQTPAPWCNVIANPLCGCLVTESALGYTWAENSGENRLTPWLNDPVSDEPAEALYLRDEETAAVWTPTRLPVPDGGAYQTRHGAGYTEFRHNSRGLVQSMRVYATPHAPLKIVRLRVRNTGSRNRRLTATYYAEWTLGTLRSETQAMVVPEHDPRSGALLARCDWNPEFAGRTAFLASTLPTHGFTVDRREFLGRDGGPHRPAALERWGLSGRADPGLDPCAALQVHLDVEAGQEVEVAFLLGQGSDREEALRLIAEYRDEARVQAAWEELGEFWDGLLGKVSVSTPEPSMDLMLNRWLPYQSLSARLFGRTGLYQSSGAMGFRDQLQDVMSMVHLDPALTRAQILRAARHQFEAGDVLHWWHPPSGRGVRTRCSDDLLWLPFVTAHYVHSTGDESILYECLPFLEGEPLAPGEDDRYAQYAVTSETASLFDHCLRALERGRTAGAHGLPLIGSCDWNDGMNRVGEEGRGESVWLAWFQCATYEAFAKVCDRVEREDQSRVWRERARELAAVVEDQAWDGAWYRRAYDDEGKPLGSSECVEGRIDSIAQSWSAISGAGDPERVRTALRSAERELVRRHDRLVLLLWPPYDTGPTDPGYIKGYPRGVRENGGQYTHASTWLGWAFAAQGDGDRAEEIFRLINPILHAQTDLSRYRVEPYVIPADVYGMEPHVGRGGWTWYTGAASWCWRLGLEAILGLRRVEGELEIDPCIPSTWSGYEAVLRGDRGVCRIRVENPDGICRGVSEILLDGAPVPDGRVPISALDGEHEVRVRLGPQVLTPQV